MQAIGRFEGYYGFASSPQGWYGSNNWGAIQCGHAAPCGDDCFEAGDHSATGVPYRTCFRRYPTPDAGAAALVHELYRRPSVVPPLRQGDALGVATAMRQTGYHETAPEKYGAAIARNAQAIASSLGEPLQIGARRSSSSGAGPFVLFLGVFFAARRWWPKG